MNMINKIFKGAALCLTIVSMVSCADKNGEVIAEQTGLLNESLQETVSENPELIASANAQYVDGAIKVDVKTSDSLIMTSLISEPLFDFFTACQIKNNLTKDLEVTVNALSAKNENVIVTLTDVYGDSKEFTLSAAKIKKMVKSPLTQLNYNEARQSLIEAMTASEEQFRPAGAKVESINTSFKGGFVDYTVTFDNAAYYKPLKTANLKYRAIEVLNARYAKLGVMRGEFFEMFKALGIDGFHLIYNAGEKAPFLKCTVLLSDLK